jgi:hypothetical protein
MSHEEVEVQLHPFLNSTLLVCLKPMPLCPRRNSPPVPVEYKEELARKSIWTLQGVKEFCPCREWNLDFSVVQPVAVSSR